MSGVSVSHAIMFIASLVVAAAVAGVLISGVGSIGGAIEDRSGSTSEQIKTDYTIVSDPNSEEQLYELNDDQPDRIEFNMKNTGANELIADNNHVTILVNGRLAEDKEFTVHGDGDEVVWERNSVVTVGIEQTTSGALDLGTGSDISIHVDINGHEESFQFRTEE